MKIGLNVTRAMAVLAAASAILWQDAAQAQGLRSGTSFVTTGAIVQPFYRLLHRNIYEMTVPSDDQ